MIYPGNLKPGDRVAIISPSSPVRDEYIDGAAEFLRARGLEPVVMPHARGPVSGSYAASDADRLDDFIRAWQDPSIRAVLCSRGGYGAVHLISRISPDLLRGDPKWLIGFSDITALHAALFNAGVASLHAPMAKHLSLEGAEDESSVALMDILEKGLPAEYVVGGNALNRPGEAEGILAGGNLAVFNGLAGSRFDFLAERAEEESGGDLILFIEDISEAIYAVERMLYRIWLSGGFEKVAGLIVGQFTEYRPDRNYSAMEEMISAFLTRAGITDIPVAFGFPAGHVKHNLPLVEGARARLSVTADRTVLRME